jgi:hypothetical protein
MEMGFAGACLKHDLNQGIDSLLSAGREVGCRVEPQAVNSFAKKLLFGQQLAASSVSIGS